MKSVFRQLGFTMVELLVVIAIIGLLAAGILAALNPIEQINKSRDAGYRADASQLASQIEGYFAANLEYPWVSANSPTGVLNTTAFDTTPTGRISQAQLAPLQTSGSVKPAFVSKLTATTYPGLRVYKATGETSSVYVCFPPVSDQGKADAAAKCTQLQSTTPPAVPANYCTAGSELLCIP